jgi:hypothetical protein
MAAQLNKPGTLSVGFLSNARTYPGGANVATIAVFQEFGTPNARFPIPPRPFFRNMVKAKSPEWPKAVAQALKDHDYDASAALHVVGDAIAGQLRESIIDTNAPALSPVTLLLRQWRTQGRKINLTTVIEAIRQVKGGTRAGKKFAPGTPGAKPLVETGIMLGSVDYEIT